MERLLSFIRSFEIARVSWRHLCVTDRCSDVMLRVGHFTLMSVPCSVCQEDFMMLINRIQPHLQKGHSSPAMKVDRIQALQIKGFNNFLGAPDARNQWLHIYTHF